ncbi:hypothetical protein IAU60_004987 [Kwoniella sp. DSM 27419]
MSDHQDPHHTAGGLELTSVGVGQSTEGASFQPGTRADSSHRHPTDTASSRFADYVGRLRNRDQAVDNRDQAVNLAQILSGSGHTGQRDDTTGSGRYSARFLTSLSRVDEWGRAHQTTVWASAFAGVLFGAAIALFTIRENNSDHKIADLQSQVSDWSAKWTALESSNVDLRSETDFLNSQLQALRPGSSVPDADPSTHHLLLAVHGITHSEAGTELVVSTIDDTMLPGHGSGQMTSAPPRPSQSPSSFVTSTVIP